MPTADDTRASLASAFARAGFHAAQSSLADIALDWMRGYLARADVVERAVRATATKFATKEIVTAALRAVLEDTP